VKHDMRALHLCSDRPVFLAMVPIVLAKWRADGHADIATYLQDTYLEERWDKWYLGCLPFHGTDNTNNSLESHNKWIKLVMGKTRLSLADMVMRQLPRFLRYFYDFSYNPVYNTYTSIQAIDDMLIPHQLWKSVSTTCSNVPFNVKLVDNAYWINDSIYRDKLQVTTERIVTYMQLQRVNTVVEGTTPTLDEFKSRYQSLHKVVNVNGTFMCTCKYYAHSSLLCSHVLAVIHISKTKDLSVHVAELSKPRKRGRPKSRGRALQLA